MIGGKNPFDGEVQPRKLVRYLNSPSRMQSLLTENIRDGNSPAEIFADIITVIRADQKMVGQAVGVDLEANRMEEERAAELISGVLDGDGIELVLLFNRLAEDRDKILRELLDEEEYQAFSEEKTSVMLTDDPQTIEEYQGDSGAEQAVADGGEEIDDGDDDVEEETDE